jgi:hypothetical protein
MKSVMPVLIDCCGDLAHRKIAQLSIEGMGERSHLRGIKLPRFAAPLS